MTGKEWNDYFRTLSKSKKRKILRAVSTLEKDPMFTQAFGNSFRELAYLLISPLNQEEN